MERKVIPLFGEEAAREDGFVLENGDVVIDDGLDEEIVEAVQELAEEIRAFAIEVKQHPAYNHKNKINQTYIAAACAMTYVEDYIDASEAATFQVFENFGNMIVRFDQRLSAIEKKVGIIK